MINLWEENTLKFRYYEGDLLDHHGLQTTDDDKEEWIGIRSQLLALFQGWA